MDSETQLSVRAVYSLTNSYNGQGIEGYHVQKKYVDPLQQIQERQFLKIKKGQKPRKHATKRGNFLDDEAKVHKIVPGPGQYPFTDEWPEEKKLKVHHADKKTFIDEIIKQQKRQKKPAPGQYNVVKTLKQEEAEVKRLAARKITVQDRLTYLDHIQFQSNNLPGVGMYNPRKRAKTQVVQSSTKNKPQDWRKKHELQQKKKPPKTPDMTTYKPTPSSYTVFDTLSKIKHNKNFLGKVDRFKTSASGSGLPPARYSVIQQWRGKDKKKLDRHGIEVLSKSGNKSVYYN